MSGRARPQYFDVVRAAHDANQQSDTGGRRQDDHSREARIVEKISSEGFHHTASGHLGNQVADFFNSNQRVWSAKGIALLEDGIDAVGLTGDQQDLFKC